MENLTSNQNNLPLVMAPADVAAVLGISKTKMYEVLHSNGFPAFRIGKQYRVNRDKFLDWLSSVEAV